MSEEIIEQWKIVDKWWTDEKIEREYKVVVNETVWVRTRISDGEWSDWELRDKPKEV